MSFRLSSAAGACSLLALSIAHAQTTVLDPVVVTATRIDTPLYDSLPSVSVITRSQIENTQAPSLAELLQSQVGVEFGRNGGPGSVTSFFLRGANSTNVVILIDGVRAAVDGWGNLTAVDIDPSQIERIEVLRGNASALYGEAAIGGVIQITTRSAAGKSGSFASVGLGSRGANAFNVGHDGQAEGLAYHFGLGGSATARLSSINPSVKALANPDADLNQSQHLDLSLRYALSQVTRLSGYLRANKSDLTFDRDTLPSDLHTLERSSTSVGLSARTKVTQKWSSEIGFDHADLGQKDWLNGAPVSFNAKINSHQNSLRWNNTYATDAVIFSAGTEVSRLSFNNTGALSKRQADAIYGAATAYLDTWTLQASLRHDRVHADQKSTDSNTTGQWHQNSGLLGLGYDLNSRWRLTASTSTGFRAPSPGELSSNDQLQPELHRSVEAGLSHQRPNNEWRLVAFSTRTTNAIAWPGSTPENIGRTNNQGLEFSGRTKLNGVYLRYSLTSQDPRNSETQQPLARRARIFATLSFDKTWGDNSFGVIIHTSGNRRDSDYSNEMLAGYTTLDLKATYRLNTTWTLHTRLENLLDERYELASGYNTPRRGVFVTLKYAPK